MQKKAKLTGILALCQQGMVCKWQAIIQLCFETDIDKNMCLRNKLNLLATFKINDWT